MENIFKRYSHKGLICLVVAVAIAPCAYGGESRVSNIHNLSIENAVALAFKNNKEILAQEKEIEIARARILGAVSESLPKIDLNGGYSHQDAVMSIGPAAVSKKDIGVFVGYNNQNDLGVSARQPLFEGGKNLALFKCSRIELKIQEESFRVRRHAVEFETKRLYYGLLLAYETERINGELVSQAKSHYMDVERRFREGAASRFDLLQSKVQISKVEPELARAQKAKNLIAEELKKLLGLERMDVILLTGELAYTLIQIDEDRFLEQAQSMRPELEMRSLEINADKQGIKIARSGWLPKINGEFNYYSKSDAFMKDVFNSQHNNWNIGVRVTIPIFDGFSAKAKVDEAKARYSQTIIKKEDVEDQVVLEIRHACFDLSEAKTIIDSAQEGVESAREALKIAEASYREGQVTNLDVLDAQISLSQIEKNLSDAIYDYIVALAYLDKSIGRSPFEETKNEN